MTPLAIEDDAHGFVVSNSDDFDMAADGCFELVHETFPELAALQSDAAAFGDGVRRALVRRLTPGLTRALLARFSCVREAGFPRLEPAAAVEEPSLERILRSAGVQPGVAGETAGEKTSEDVRAREVTVFDPPPARTYRPSAEEKQFADAYVRCGRQQRFTARLRESVKVSLAVLESRFQTRAASLADRLTRLGDDLVSTTTLGR